MNALGEPTLQSLGLADWWPTGRVQMILEFIHVNLGISWVGSIVLFTIALRCCLFYFTIKAQRNGANMRKHTPRLNELKEKWESSKKTGNSIESKINIKTKFSSDDRFIIFLLLKKKQLNELCMNIANI